MTVVITEPKVAGKRTNFVVAPLHEFIDKGYTGTRSK